MPDFDESWARWVASLQKTITDAGGSIDALIAADIEAKRQMDEFAQHVQRMGAAIERACRKEPE